MRESHQIRKLVCALIIASFLVMSWSSRSESFLAQRSKLQPVAAPPGSEPREPRYNGSTSVDASGARRATAAPLRWQLLPATPALPAPITQGVLPINGARIYFARFGRGEPVILLHGGLGNSSYWGNQIAALTTRYEVIVMDARGHGRSTLPPQPISYELMTDDVIGLMQHLAIPKAAIVGWSDGAIIGLMLAIKYPERVTKLFAFGANFDRGGLIRGGSRSPAFAKYTARTAEEYRQLSPHPTKYPELLRAMNRLWQGAPEIRRLQLARLRMPVLIVDGDHDEIIQRSHTEALASAIGSARLLIERNVSHFAMLQDPEQFNADLLHFLEDSEARSGPVSHGQRVR